MTHPEPTAQHALARSAASRRGSLPALLLLGQLLVPACSTATVIETSEQYRSVGNIQLAFRELEAARLEQQAQGSVSPQLEQAYRELRPLFLIERGRQAIYRDQEQEGLRFLEEALAVDPDNEAARELVARAYRKMAARATRSGQDLLAKGDLVEAMRAFQQAVVSVPDYEDAVEGMAAVRKTVASLHTEAQQQYLEAIRKLPELRFQEVEWHAAAALTRDPTLTDAEKVQLQAQRQLAEDAVRRAEFDKLKSAFGAALMEYRSARANWPTLAGVDEHIAHMEREVEAQTVIERAMLDLNAGRLDEAREKLDAAYELTSLQRASINELRHQVRLRAGEIAYLAARDLELQGKKGEALAAFEQVAEEWPDGLRDEKTRIRALRSDIENAEQEYEAGAAAQAAGDAAAALEHFRTARTFYSGYRDVHERIAALEAADGKVEDAPVPGAGEAGERDAGKDPGKDPGPPRQGAQGAPGRDPAAGDPAAGDPPRR